MPLLGNLGLLPIPWSMIGPHEEQAMKNHDQTLLQLARRGGLSVSEAVAVLEDRPWCAMIEIQAIARLGELASKMIERESE